MINLQFEMRHYDRMPVSMGFHSHVTDEARRATLLTRRKPATIGEILTEEFLQPLGLTEEALAEAMGVQLEHVKDLCNNRRSVTVATARILASAFGNSPAFWLNVQLRNDLAA